MMFFKTKFFIGVLSLASLFLCSCEKKTLTEDENLPENVSFQTQVLPLFNNCHGCHNAANPPDLSESNAYRSLIQGDYINTGSPKESLLMEKLYGNHSNYLDSDEKKIILGWITEGAKNN